MCGRSKESVDTVIRKYLSRKDVPHKNLPWAIKESALGGLGVFAKRDIQPGEVIFHDQPVILGPRCLPELPDMCANCYSKSNLEICRKCGLRLCKSPCGTPNSHEDECRLIQQLKPDCCDAINSRTLLKCLTPLRSLLLSEEDKQVVYSLKYHPAAKHGKEVEVLSNVLKFSIKDEEVEFLIRVCSVLDANAFEVVVGDEGHQTNLRGLYPLGGLANHRCYPNTTHVFDEGRNMVVTAAVPVKEGDELFHSYSRVIWATSTRQFHLLETKHFVCKCERCEDPTEFDTYMNAVYCSKCRGKVISVNPLKLTCWRCEECKRAVPVTEVGHILSRIGTLLKVFGENDFKVMYSFLTGKLRTLVPATSQVAVEIKYKIIWILGYADGYKWDELSMELLNIKMSFCNDIILLLEQLRSGKSKMRGLLLFETYLCLEECKRRHNNNESDIDCTKYFEEAAEILRYDVSAPNVIKQKWQRCSGNNDAD